MQVQTVIPQLRITHASRSLRFYEDGLGFVIDWKHHFEPGFPLFIQLTRNGQTIFLTEHTGDCEVGGEFLGRIAQGRAQFGGRWASQLALPSSCAGPVTLELAFANRSQLLLQATGLACRYEGEANFSESLFC